MREINSDGGHEINVRPRGQSLDRANEIKRRKPQPQPRAESDHVPTVSSSKSTNKRRDILNDLNHRKADLSPKNMLNNKVLNSKLFSLQL